MVAWCGIGVSCPLASSQHNFPRRILPSGRCMALGLFVRIVALCTSTTGISPRWFIRQLAPRTNQRSWPRIAGYVQRTLWNTIRARLEYLPGGGILLACTSPCPLAERAPVLRRVRARGQPFRRPCMTHTSATLIRPCNPPVNCIVCREKDHSVHLTRFGPRNVFNGPASRMDNS